MELTFREDYWDVPELKQEYIRFLIQLFRVDLTAWDSAGYWDIKYRPFSFFDGTALVSNVCIYSMDMRIDGVRRSVAQVSAVGTVPEYRRRGLSNQLTRTAIEWARSTHDFFFLFADDGAHEFYKQCGFRSVQEHKARLPVIGRTPLPGAVQLDMHRTDHVELANRLATTRVPVSDVLGVSNSKLFMFWCLTYLKDCIQYLPELDVLVLLRREGSLVTIFDIVGTSVPTFAELYPLVSQPGDEAVDFLFMADKLGLSTYELIEVEGNGTHLLGPFPLDGTRFLFPFTAHA